MQISQCMWRRESADQQDSCDAGLPRLMRLFTPYAIHYDFQLSVDSDIFSLDCFFKIDAITD